MGAERARLPAPAGRKRRTKQPPEHLSGRPAPSPDIVEKASFRTPTKKDDAPRLLRPENDSRHDGPRLGTQRGDAFLRTHNDRKFHRAHSDRREKDAAAGPADARPRMKRGSCLSSAFRRLKMPRPRMKRAFARRKERLPAFSGSGRDPSALFRAGRLVRRAGLGEHVIELFQLQRPIVVIALYHVAAGLLDELIL